MVFGVGNRCVGGGNGDKDGDEITVLYICNLRSTISVHVAQWLDHLTGHQKDTGLGCTP